ncbi:LamG-like jellyroll fold domain-containing protein [Streptomyces sp. NPDC055051]
MTPKVTVEVAFDGGPFSKSYTWTDISDYVRGFQIRRGRNYELDRIEAGTLSLTLDNSDGRFTPGKQKSGVNALAAAAPTYRSLSGAAAGAQVEALTVLKVEADGRARFASRTVYTNGKPVACYFAVQWNDADGWLIKFDQGTRFVADSDPAVYTHVETPPPGAAWAVLHIFADGFPEGNDGLVVTAEKAEWVRAQPYYPNVVPRRRVRVRTPNLVPRDVSTGGDSNESTLNFDTYYSPSLTECSWKRVPRSGTGSIFVQCGTGGTAAFASAVRCGKGRLPNPSGMTRVSPGRTYTASAGVRLGGASRDVSLAGRIIWHEQDGTPLPPGVAKGATVKLTSPRGNLALNPRVEVDLSNTQLYGTATNLSRARVTTDAYVGSGCIEHTHTTDLQPGGTTWTIEQAQPGQTVSFGVWVKVPATGIVSGQLAWRQGGNTHRLINLPQLPPSGGWFRLTGSYTLAEGQTVDRVGVSFVGAAGTKWYADACHAAVSATPPHYADGSYDGWRWAGTAHASASAPVLDDSGPGTWVQLPAASAMAPTGASWATFEIGTQGGDNGAGFYVDEVQIEEGSQLGPWSPGGSIFHGYIERWPVVSEGLAATVDVTAVDGMAVLSSTDLRTPMQEQVMSTGPLGYWPLGDAEGAKRLENVVNDQEPARLAPSKYGPGTARLGADSIVRNDPATSYSLTNVAANQGTVIDICDNGSRRYRLWFEFSVAFWCQPVLPSSGAYGTLFRSWGENGGDHVKVQVNSSGKLVVSVTFLDGSVSVTSAGTLSTSKPTFVVVSVRNGLVTTCLNGALDSQAQAFAENDYLWNLNWSSLGGAQAGSFYQEYANGRYGHLAIWDRELSFAEVEAMWAVGDFGGKDFSENEKERITRLAVMSRFNEELALDEGLSTLQGPSWSSGSKALDVIQEAAEDASGYVFMDGDGRLTYHNRSRRQGALPRFELGDSLGLPYEPGLTFEMDEDQIINEVTFKRPGGSEGVLKDRGSISEFGRKSRGVELRLTSDAAVQDAAYMLLNQYSTPVVRCDSVSLNATATPALFYFAIAAEIGDRIRLSDLPAQAPESSLDFYVEAISTDVAVNGSVIEWRTTLSLSPAGGTDVWILESSTFGRLDRSTVLAY